MRLGFLSAALAAGLAAGALASLVTWLVAILAGDPLGALGSPGVILLFAMLVATVTFLAEEVALRRTYAEMRASGEPWAYRGR